MDLIPTSRVQIDLSHTELQGRFQGVPIGLVGTPWPRVSPLEKIPTGRILKIKMFNLISKHNFIQINTGNATRGEGGGTLEPLLGDHKSFP